MQASGQISTNFLYTGMLEVIKTRSKNLKLVCVQPSISLFNLQLPHVHHGRHGHGGHNGHGDSGGHVCHGGRGGHVGNGGQSGQGGQRSHGGQCGQGVQGGQGCQFAILAMFFIMK